MLRRVIVIGGAVLVLVAVVLALSFIPSDHYIVLPDRARPTDPLVSIPGEETEPRESGIYMVDVRVGRATLLERIYPGIHEGASLLPEHVVNPAGVSDTQRRRSSLNDMSRSQLVAITVALRELDEEVEVDEAGAEVVLVQPGAPAEDGLEVGDVIVEADGEEVESTADLQRAMSDVEPGERVAMAVERPEQGDVDLTLTTQAAEDDADRAIVGVQVQNALDFEFPVDIEIDAGAIGGPSAGLAFALDIVDELGDDLSGDRTIVATGALTLDGEVLPIGGIKQKTIGARESGADVFLVPDGNAAEAREAADGLEIVAVSTFQEALSALATA